MSTNQPEPSQASLDLVGHTVTHTSTRRPHPTECTVQTAEKVFSTISRADGTTWSSVRFKLKPLDGGRAFWTDCQWIPAAALAGRLTDGTWTAYTPEQLVAALGIGQDSTPVAPESDANPSSAPAVPLDQEIELQPLIVGPQFVRVDPRLWVNPTLVFAIRTLEGSNGCRMYGSGGHVVDVDAPVDEVLDLLTGGDQ